MVLIQAQLQLCVQRSQIKEVCFNCRHVKAEIRAFYDVRAVPAQNKNRIARELTSVNGFRGRLNFDGIQNSELIQILT